MFGKNPVSAVVRLRKDAGGARSGPTHNGYNMQEFIVALRARQVTPYITRNDHVTKTGKRHTSAIDRRARRRSLGLKACDLLPDALGVDSKGSDNSIVGLSLHENTPHKLGSTK